MDLHVIGAVALLAVCQAEAGVLCSRLYPPRFGKPKQAMLQIFCVAAAACLGLLGPASWLAVFIAGAACNCLVTMLLYGVRAVPAALLGGNLCLLAGLATRALSKATSSEIFGPVNFILFAVWLFLNGIMLGFVIIVAHAMHGWTINWSRFLVNTGYNLQFASIGLFICRIQTTGSPYVPAAAAVALALGISYVFLLRLHAGMLRRHSDQQRRQEIIQAELQEQEQEFAAWTAVLSSARRMRHDYVNHAMVARSLADAGETEAALAYLEKVRSAWEKALPGVELQAFGQLSGILAQSCAACGIELRIGGQVPKDAGVRSQSAQGLLRNVTEWAIRRLRGKENAVLELDLCGPEALECRLEPAGLPSAELQAELRRCCVGNAVDFRADGPALRLRIWQPPVTKKGPR